jgi:hypothetical protein
MNTAPATDSPGAPPAGSGPLALTTCFGRRRATTPVATLDDASRVFAELRDRSAVPSSRAKDGVVRDRDSRVVAIVSYNGRVWGPEGWRAGAASLLEAQDAGIRQ